MIFAVKIKKKNRCYYLKNISEVIARQQMMRIKFSVDLFVNL